MTWQILRIYADGSIDLIGSMTSQRVYFKLANGYNNGVTVMNDICETLYSRGTIKARSVNYEDLEYWLTDEGKKVRDEYNYSGTVYGHTKTYTSVYKRYPNLYAQEKGAKIDSGLNGLTEGIDKEQGNTTGLGISEEGTASGATDASTSLTVTQTYWAGDMSSENFGTGYNVLKQEDFSYWLSSRYAGGGSSYANFGLLCVTPSHFEGVLMYASYGSTSIVTNGRLRPIVCLSPSVQIKNCTGENGINNMHQIIQY